jgi:PEP-CTERM motif
MKTRTRARLIEPYGLALAAILLVPGTQEARADAVTTLPVTVASGSTTAEVTFDFDLSSAASAANGVGSFDYDLAWSSSMTLEGELVNGQLTTDDVTPFGADSDLSANNLFGADTTPGSSSVDASWVALFSNITVPASTSVTYLFDLGTGFQSGSVDLTQFDYGIVGSDYSVTSVDLVLPTGPPVTAAVTATSTTSVPEPSTVSLMLAGVGLLGLGALISRRRKTLKS